MNNDPLTHDSNWMTPAQAAAARKRKETEPRRIFGAVLLAGILSAGLGLATGRAAAFVFGWIVLGVLFASWACDEDGPEAG